jgi:YfiH family protein
MRGRFDGDFIGTHVPGLKVGVKVADCTALLVASKDRVVAIHAGWRGSAQGILTESLKGFEQVSELEIWLSPSICQKHFEVGEDVLQAFGPKARSFFKDSSERNGFYFFDLKAWQVTELEKLGCDPSKIKVDTRCTFCEPAMISYRRAQGKLTHLDRHWAWISLQPR